MATGLEVRCRYDLERDPVRTQLTSTLADARMIAAQWREGTLGVGGFLELDVGA